MTDSFVAMGSVTATGHTFTNMKYVGVDVRVAQDFEVEAIADFGGDGKSDILWRNTAGNIAVWEMNGAAIANPNWVKTSTGADLVIPWADWAIVGAEYLGNDHRADILWRNKWDGKWAIWEMNSGVLQTGSNLKMGDPWQDLSKTPAGMAGRPVAIDEAGNTTEMAFKVGVLTTQASFQGAVDAWDTADVYRFEVSGTQLVSVRLDGMAARTGNQNVNMTLLGSNGTTVFGTGKNLGAEAELIQMNLAVGIYYVQVNPAGPTDYNSYRLSLGVVPLTASLAFSTATDSGVSGDGITKNNRPMVQGTGPVGSVLKLYGQASTTGTTVNPEVLLGSVTVGSSGELEIQSSELADGDYSLVAKIDLSNGQEQRISQAWGVKIDTIRPDLRLTNLIDGIAWERTESLDGNLIDRDDLSKVQYWFKLKTGNTAAKTLNVVNGRVALDQQLVVPTVDDFTEQTVVFKTWDRAENEQVLEYQFMLMGNEGPGTNYPVDPTDKIPLTPDPTTGQAGQPVNNGRAAFAGENGNWGFGDFGTGTGGGTGGSGGTGGGTGGTGWRWTNYAGFSMNPGPGLLIQRPTSNTPSLPSPIPQPATELTYVDAVEAIAQIAEKALSNGAGTRLKKAQMGIEISSLKGVAKFVQEYGLYDVMGSFFHGLWKAAYDPTDGKITRAQATVMGLTLAERSRRILRR
ncbi:MAG: hypothetical protein HC860_25615 [Alkalinema sp. RU_4_3]|nr:hypothetical protein [Alkalinema sp. RU_4_3]